MANHHAYRTSVRGDFRLKIRRRNVAGTFLVSFFRVFSRSGGVVMTQLCFATYARALQSSLMQPAQTYHTRSNPAGTSKTKVRTKATSSNEYVVGALLNWIIDTFDVDDRQGNLVWLSTKTISQLMSQKIELNAAIIGAIARPEVIKASDVAFQKIEKRINPHTRTDLLSDIASLIKNDETISEATVTNLLSAWEVNAAHFLAQTFLYAASKTNLPRPAKQLIASDFEIASRSGDRCPRCRTKRLYRKVKGKSVPNFEVLSIPALPQSKEIIKIALCPQCARDVAGSADIFGEPDEWVELRALHQQLAKALELAETLDTAQIGEEIRQVVDSLTSEPLTGSGETISLDALTIDNKLAQDEILLREILPSLVIKHYRRVENLFSSLDQGRRATFTMIATQVRAAYLQAARTNNNQQSIFEAIVHWIMNAAHTDKRDGAYIVAAFFVQNCEVFDETTQ